MNRRGWIQLTVVSVLWGAVYPLGLVALRDLTPVQVVFGRAVLGALVLGPMAIHRDALRELWRRPRLITETVLLQMTIPLVVLTFGQKYISAGLAGIIIGAQPVILAVLAPVFAPDQRPGGWRAVTGIVVGFAGLALIFGVDLRDGRNALLGGALCVVSAFCYAAGAIVAHRRHVDASPLGVTTSAMLVTAVALAVPSVLTPPAAVPAGAVVSALLVLGLLCTGLALFLYFSLLSEAGPARAALAFYLSPGFAVILGALFLDETVRPTAIVGLVAIVAGSVLAADRDRRVAPVPALRE